MAKLPRGGAPHLRLALLAFLLLAPPTAAAGVDLVGTWHVLIHYTDDNTSHPDQLRWNDRVWVFEREGDRLIWKEYPIVVFSDETDRFERLESGQYARVLGAWEPSQAQLRNIAAGLRFNSRGAKKKSLRGSDLEGWRTSGRVRPGSASVITYHEDWRIEGLPEAPVFLHRDVMGSARSETMEGLARYQSSSVEAGGSLIRGSYERDGTRHGSFVMRRSGELSEVGEGDPMERLRQRIQGGARADGEE
jgi:hypothetical protein